jgi:hypothetical protein
MKTDTKYQVIADESENLLSNYNLRLLAEYDNEAQAIERLIQYVQKGWLKMGEIRHDGETIAHGSRNENTSGYTWSSLKETSKAYVYLRGQCIYREGWES